MTHPSAPTLAEQIRLARLAYGMGQGELGAWLGRQLGLDAPIDRNTIGRWERGTVKPGRYILPTLRRWLEHAPRVPAERTTGGMSTSYAVRAW
jgi:hypothetical protein